MCEPQNPEIGLTYLRSDNKEAQFILLPRKEALAINSDGRKVCAAMATISKKESNVIRGTSKTVFGENKYCCVGAKPRRNARGVEPGMFHLKGVAMEDWNTVVRAVKRCEHAFYAYSDTEVIAHIREARKIVPWETIQCINDGGKNSNPTIYNGIAFGVNVYLRAHIDQDFTYSVIQVHVNGMDYGLDDDVVCYFCFPRLGVAVSMRPGDFLLVNALEYHCLSSRCNTDVDIFCVSSYLKTAVVGGNDNKRTLDSKEQKCQLAYEYGYDQKLSSA